VGRCKYQLSDFSIGKILQATIGGTAADFRLQWISDHVYKFVVASKNVGFHIYNLRSFSCDQYNIFFHLWSNVGAHWVSESKKFFHEENEQWTTVQQKNRSNKTSAHRLTGANRVPVRSHNSSRRNSVFDRIDWLEISSKGSLNAQQNSSSSHHRNPSSTQSVRALWDQRTVRFQNSNRQSKNRGLLLEEPNKESSVPPVSCPICAASNRPRSSCRSLGHIVAHCMAQ
jgi:hypothetical protein